MADDMRKTGITGGVATNRRHDSAHKHVSGSAAYIDDMPEPKALLHGYIAMSPVAYGELISLDLDIVKAAPGVAAVLTPADIPGKNAVGPVRDDDPLLTDGTLEYIGQPVFCVLATSLEAARRAAKLAVWDIAEKPPILTIDQALAAGEHMHLEPVQHMGRGDADAAIDAAPHALDTALTMGGQDHFYLEGQIAMAVPGEDGDVLVHSSTQHPSEVQHLVSGVLDIPDSFVTVEVRRMGGGFGGKETQAVIMAALAALGAHKTGRPVKIRLDRDDDMEMTGKRHDFQIKSRIGFTDGGVITGYVSDLASRCGRSLDLSAAINDRALFHSDNCYYLDAVQLNSARLKTHTVSNTAFRGFGGPQGMLMIERVMDTVAFAQGMDPLDVRLANLYGAPGSGRDKTPYGMTVEDSVAGDILQQLADSSNYRARRAAIRDWNQTSPVIKRGIAITPVKFGISFTTTFLNQAGALVHVYTDGSVHLNHGGTEMGQGLFVKVAQVVAEEFQIDIDHIKITATNTGKVPNTSATAASSGSDLNGMAAQAAARTIKARLIDFAADHFDCAPADVVFAGGEVRAGNHVLTFSELAKQAYLARVSLSSTGYYKTPEIHYDRSTHTGRPFYYFAYGAAVSEVAIDSLTGENRVLAVDILHDVGKSLNPVIDKGQIEGGFIQGMGWLTTEELVFDAAGKLRTHAPSTYKIPATSDRPQHFNIDLFDNENVMPTIHRSKAVGEPPFMLAISVFSALTDAVAASGDYARFPDLHAPATPEAVLMAVRGVQATTAS